LKYHVNNNGEVGICRAKKGNCPYGGGNGTENHFDTKEEAQIHSQKMLEAKNPLLPNFDSAIPLKEKFGSKIDCKSNFYFHYKDYRLKKLAKNRIGYIHRCKYSKRLDNFEITKKSDHVNNKRKRRVEFIEKELDDGEFMGYYEVYHYVAAKGYYEVQIMEMFDNGRINIYGENGTNITTIVGQRTRIETVMLMADDIPTQSMLDKVDKNYQEYDTWKKINEPQKVKKKNNFTRRGYGWIK